jgi:hypothetical protein
MIEDGTIVISRRGRGGTVKGFKVAEEGDFEEEG